MSLTNIALQKDSVNPAGKGGPAVLRWADFPVCYTGEGVPFLTEPDAGERCRRATEALAVWARAAGEDGPGEEVITAVTGLLADLMLLCERYGVTGEGLSFSAMVTMAEIHHESERE